MRNVCVGGGISELSPLSVSFSKTSKALHRLGVTLPRGGRHQSTVWNGWQVRFVQSTVWNCFRVLEFSSGLNGVFSATPQVQRGWGPAGSFQPATQPITGGVAQGQQRTRRGLASLQAQGGSRKRSSQKATSGNKSFPLKWHWLFMLSLELKWATLYNPLNYFLSGS